jgi:hypothetical protein
LNQKHGYGKYTCSDGTVYQGQWSQDQRKGKGRVTYANGNWFEGVFDEDQQEGIAGFGEWKIEGALKDA